LNFGKRLTMADVTVVSLASLEFVNVNFRTAPLGQNSGPDPLTAQGGAIDGDLPLAAEQKHVVEFDFLADLALDLLDAKPIPGLNPVLLTAGADYGIHG
jgi:hypothetical protein